MECMRDGLQANVVLNRRFKTLAPLNKGSFGMVISAKDLYTDDTVAIKCLAKNVEESISLEFNIDNHSEELPLHQRIGSHPNIVNLITSFETANHAYLVLEYCPNGDLYEAIRSGKGPLETEHVRDFMLQLVKAVEHMHAKGVYHRDIKPENIFLSESGSMKLGDFGLATREQLSFEYGVGSDRYMAPEQFDPALGQGYSPAAADIWSVGICLLNVLFGRNPFATPTTKDPLYADFVHDRQSLFDVFPTMSQDTFDVLMEALIVDPTKRSLASVRDALNRVVSFTTDDEALDEFCLRNDMDTTGATFNREPLRTPSVHGSPLVDNSSFPWTKAIAATPRRSLTTIHDDDDEDIFPLADVGDDSEVCKPKYDIDNASWVSGLDSGIAMSYKSGTASCKPLDFPLATSLPTSRALAAVYANDNDMFSKSWSDLWDEEEELQRRSFESDEHEVDDMAALPQTRSSTPAIDIVSSRGSSTPRAGPEDAAPSLRARLANQVKQMAASAPHGNKASPHKRMGSSLMDKWAALGHMRRINTIDEPSNAVEKTNGFGEFGKFKHEIPNKQRTIDHWRKGTPAMMHENWNRSDDWRSMRPATAGSLPSYEQAIGSFSVKSPTTRRSPRSNALNLLGKKKQGTTNTNEIYDDDDDDTGDLEWIGGMNDLQL